MALTAADDGRRGWSVWKAAAAGDAERVAALINAHGAGMLVARNPYNGRAPLHEACAHGRERVVRVLLSSGCRFDLRSFRGRDTPLHFAAANGRPACVKVLLRRARAAGRRIADRTNKYGCTALHAAVDALSVRYLLEAGASSTLRCGRRGWTPLQYALDRGQAQCAQLLSGAVVDVVREREQRAREAKRAQAARIEAQKQGEEAARQAALKAKVQRDYELWKTPHVSQAKARRVIKREKLSVFRKKGAALEAHFREKYGT